MKTILIILALIALAVAPAVAALDTYDTVTNITVSSVKLASGVQTNGAVDVAIAKGTGHLLVSIGPARTNAADFGASATLRTCATSGGTYVPVTNGAGSEVTVTGAGITGTGAVTSVKVEAAKLQRYIKLFTVATNDTCDIGANLLFVK